MMVNMRNRPEDRKEAFSNSKSIVRLPGGLGNLVHWSNVHISCGDRDLAGAEVNSGEVWTLSPLLLLKSKGSASKG